jgi:predicted hotdog family 3-hydroxylacyl-ACP dehydratase
MSVALEIENLIPHRAPMRWINTLDHCTNQTATATACFAADDFAVVDGLALETALVECAAQTVAAALGHLAKSGSERPSAAPHGMLVAVSNFKVHTRPAAGQTLKIEVCENRRLGPMLLVTGTISCGDQIIATGNLSLYA